MGERLAPPPEQINQTLFKRSAPYGQPTLWLYGDRDRFYSLEHSARELR